MTKILILIIEDEQALLAMLAEKLAIEGYKISTAQDGEEGLAKIKEEKPDLVLLDIVMPRLSGMDVLERVHMDEDLSKIPVIIISNSGQPVEIDKALKLGARDYLVKAEFTPDEVIDKVKKVFESKMPGGTKTHKKELEEAPGHPQKKERGADSMRTDSFSRSGILVVEDDQFLRELIVKKLSEEGLEVETAIDGEEGLRITREKKPAIILLDLILPGMDGFEVLKQIKTDSNISDTAVIILSNLGQKEDVERGLSLGAVDYLIKAHFTPGEIVKKTKEVLEKLQ